MCWYKSVMSIKPRNEPRMLRWFRRTYLSYNLQPLLLKRCRELKKARAFNFCWGAQAGAGGTAAPGRCKPTEAVHRGAALHHGPSAQHCRRRAGAADLKRGAAQAVEKTAAVAAEEGKVAALSVEGVSQIIYILPERLLTLVRPSSCEGFEV